MSRFPWDVKHAQTVNIDYALLLAYVCISGKTARGKSSAWHFDREYTKKLGFAYLNRVCELACTPLHLRAVETAQGIEMAWYSYRPVAREPKRYPALGDHWTIKWEYVPVPSEIEAVFLGCESSMTEDEARSRAIGW